MAKTKLTQKEIDAIRLWVGRNRNKITEVAHKLRVSPQYVHQVLYSKRRSLDGRVERELRAAGAPIKVQDNA